MKKLVVVIDDDSRQADLLCQVLNDEASRFRAVGHDNIADAVKDFDTAACIVLDLNLQESKELDTLQQLMAVIDSMALHVPVLIWTGEFTDGIAESCIHAGAKSVMEKATIRNHEIMSRIDEAIWRNESDESLRTIVEVLCDLSASKHLCDKLSEGVHADQPDPRRSDNGAHLRSEVAQREVGKRGAGEVRIAGSPLRSRLRQRFFRRSALACAAS